MHGGEGRVVPQPGPAIVPPANSCCRWVLRLRELPAATISLGVPHEMVGATAPYTLAYHVDFLTPEMNECRVCTSSATSRAGACPHRLSLGALPDI